MSTPLSSAEVQRDSDVAGWVVASSLALALVGLAVSAYLTFEHYSRSATLACPDRGAVSCVKVTTSSYSDVHGIPVALLGLVFYVVMTVLCLPAVWRSPGRWLTAVRLGVSTAGVLMVLYLVWAELFPIGALCLWCTAVHVVTVGLFAVVALAVALRPLDEVSPPT